MLTKAQVKKLSLEELQNLALELSQKNFLLERALWGRRSEKLSRIEIEQGLLFNEIEVEAKSEEQEQAALEKEAPLFVQPHTRKKPGRRPLPKDLPSIEIIHDITDKTCSHGHTLERIGEDESKKLRVIPMRIEVERHIYPKYVCVTCAKESQESKTVIAPNSQSEVITAPREPTLIPRSFATPSLLSYILTAKFLDSLPFYRLEGIFSRSDIDLTRATMCRWAIQVAKACVRLRKLLWDELRKTKVLGIDETTVQVLKEPGRKATAQSYMWAYRAETDSGTVILFEYRPSRSGKFLSKRLHNFRGTVMCDGFSGYNSLDEMKDIQVVHCWAHVRRKFLNHGETKWLNRGQLVFRKDCSLVSS